MRTGLICVTALALCACINVEQHKTAAAPDTSVIAWDAGAAAALKDLNERTMNAHNAMDLAAFKALMATEGSLPSFDMDESGTPVRYATPADALAATEAMFGMMKTAGIKASAATRSADCRASATLGLCAIEMDVKLTMPDGQTQSLMSRGTAAAARFADGWKWIHWHGSMDAMPGIQSAMVAGAKDLKWEEVPGSGGVKVARLWEDPATHRSLHFTEFPAGWQVGRHYHSSGGHGVMLRGGLTVTEATGTVHDIGTGAYFRYPGKNVHTTASKSGGLVFEVSEGMPDLVLVDEAGEPLPQQPGMPGAPPAAQAPVAK
jgi:ketosteroid isomerase-like protein